MSHKKGKKGTKTACASELALWHTQTTMVRRTLRGIEKPPFDDGHDDGNENENDDEHDDDHDERNDEGNAMSSIIAKATLVRPQTYYFPY
jgi:hypothetical protein